MGQCTGRDCGIPHILLPLCHVCAHKYVWWLTGPSSVREWEGCLLFLMWPIGVTSWEEGFRILGLVVNSIKGS